MRFLARGRLLSILCPILGAACGSGSAKSTAAVVAAPAPAPARPPLDPALAPVRAAIEEGHADQALALLEGRAGFESECLRARAQVLSGAPVEALSTLERARVLDAGNPELCATEAEVLATLDRIQAAADVLAEGVRRSGAVPALFRAQGVIELRNQGHGEKALAALERALALDPELPFVNWPLAQAHLLVGRARLEKQPAEATRHARAARAVWPDLDGTVHDDALELEAEGLAGELRFEEALALYAELETRGRSYGETPAILHQRCATRCLLEHDRTKALEHYLAARALGMDDQGLGFGASLLAEEARLALDRGLTAAEGQDWKRAEVEFARALELAPRDLEAGNHLAVARFQNADYRGAAEAWERVLARALEAKLDLPDPVPLNLAKAWRQAGERARARKVLSDLLDRDPDGEWSAQARDLLLVLEAEDLAGK